MVKCKLLLGGYIVLYWLLTYQLIEHWLNFCKRYFEYFSWFMNSDLWIVSPVNLQSSSWGLISQEYSEIIHIWFKINWINSYYYKSLTLYK